MLTGDERSAARKLRELLYAVEMERTLGKARILQLYLALAPWGEGVCGAERAVRVHLGQRDASAVGPVAAAWLASLLPQPDALLRSRAAARRGRRPARGPRDRGDAPDERGAAREGVGHAAVLVAAGADAGCARVAAPMPNPAGP